MPSPGNTPFPFEEGVIEVGDGSTSVNLDGGSLRESAFQMPLPQGNDVDPEWPRPMDVPELVCMCVPQVPDSAEGVLGWDVVGDMVLLANEPFRGWPRG